MSAELYASLRTLADAESNSIACVLRRLAAAGLRAELSANRTAEGA